VKRFVHPTDTSRIIMEDFCYRVTSDDKFNGRVLLLMIYKLPLKKIMLKATCIPKLMNAKLGHHLRRHLSHAMCGLCSSRSCASAQSDQKATPSAVKSMKPYHTV